MRVSLFCSALALAVPSVASAADLLIGDSQGDRVMRFSGVDGSLIDLNFISESAVGDVFAFPQKATLVGNEIWVSDQTNDNIQRFSQSGSLLGTVLGPTNGLDNVRGFAVSGNTLYVANLGTANGAPGVAVRRFNATTLAPLSNLTSATLTGLAGPWDVENFDDDVVIADAGASSTNPLNDTAFVYRVDGATGDLKSIVISSNAGSGLGLIKGLAQLRNGNLLVANNGTPQRLSEVRIDQNNSVVRFFGLQNVSVIDPDGSTIPVAQMFINDAHELDNGLWLISTTAAGISTTNGVYTLDPSDGTIRTIVRGVTSPMTPNLIGVIPEPTSLSLLAIPALLLTRRRR
jgi:hypothetical protein